MWSCCLHLRSPYLQADTVRKENPLTLKSKCSSASHTEDDARAQRFRGTFPRPHSQAQLGLKNRSPALTALPSSLL